MVLAAQSSFDVSVVILAWRLVEPLRQCVQSVQDSEHSLRVEVIVVENGALPEVRSAVENLSGVRRVSLTHNVGFGQACNAGAEAALGKYILFLNDDARLDPTAISSLFSKAQAHERVGAVAALLLNSNGSIQEAGAKLLPDWGTKLLAHELYETEDAAKIFLRAREVDYGSAAALLVLRDAFIDVAGFDPCFTPAYFEDVDLCFALRLSGFLVLFDPEARVTHMSGASTRDLTLFREFSGARSGKAFRKKWLGVVERISDHDLEPCTFKSGSALEPREFPMHVETDAEKVFRTTQDLYRTWLEDSLEQSRLKLAQSIAKNVELGEIAHKFYLRLADLESRSMVGVLRWRLGLLARKLRERRHRRIPPTDP